MESDAQAFMGICIWIVIWIGLGLVGYVINRRPLSFWLGFFMGPFGWLLSAIMYTSDSKQDNSVVIKNGRFVTAYVEEDQQNKDCVVLYSSWALVGLIVIMFMTWACSAYGKHLDEMDRIAHQEAAHEREMERQKIEAEQLRIREKAKIEREKQRIEKARIEGEKARQKAIIAYQRGLALKAEREAKQAEVEMERQKILAQQREAQHQRMLEEQARQKRIKEEQARIQLEKMLNHQREQEKLDKLIAYFDDPKDWNTANEYAKKILAKGDTFDIPDPEMFDVYLQEHPVEVIETETSSMTGYTKEIGDQVEISIIINGDVLGINHIDNDDIIERRLATPEEWNEISIKDEKEFDWAAYAKRKKAEREAEARRARSRRIQRERELAQKKREQEEKANRPKRRVKVASFGSNR